MKKIFAIITLVLVSCMGNFAFASSPVEETIEKGVKAHQTTIDLSSCNATPKEVMETFNNMFNTYPVMSALDGSIKCVYRGQKTTYITIGYVNTSKEVDDTNKIITNIVNGANSKATVVEKAKYVHDYLINNCTYDYEYKNTNICSLLINKKGTCRAYSLAFKEIMDKLGIECKVVVQDDKLHSWNQIKIDDKWYNVDVTWDNNNSINGVPDSTLFMKSDNFFKLTGHNNWKSDNTCTVDL